MARRHHSMENLFIYTAIISLVISITNGQMDGPPANPYVDPKDDPYNALRYIVSNTLTAVAFVLVMLIALTQTFYTFRYGAKWMLAMVIGGYTYAIGFGCRFALHYHPDSQGILIVEYMFIVLSPCAFIAATYVLLGKLAIHLSCQKHVLLPVHKLTIIFLLSDISTFLIQASGGGMSVTHSQTQRQIGSHIFLVGLVLQLVSFSLFSGVYIRFLYRVYTLDRDVWKRDNAGPWYRDWRTLAVALSISCIGILVRSGYRVAEISQGFEGYLATTEAFFYALDTLPLVVATSMYALCWPGWFINGEVRLAEDSDKEKSFESS